MNILILGGTRFFGVHMVNDLLAKGHDITIATRGRSKDDFGSSVRRVVVERTDFESMKTVFQNTYYDVVIDKIAYCSNDIKIAMDTLQFGKYIYMSSTAVYEPKHMNTIESDFDGKNRKMIWCSREEFPYDGIKRQAEIALFQEYQDRNWVAVRYPFVIGEDDYTKRLLFYVEHVIKEIPMYIDNLNEQMGYIFSDEAGRFMSYLVDGENALTDKLFINSKLCKNHKLSLAHKLSKENKLSLDNMTKIQEFCGPINGCNQGTISLKEVIEYVEKCTGKHAVLTKDGDIAPYNGEPEYSINTDLAYSLGYHFGDMKQRIYGLLDYYISAELERKRTNED